MFSSEPWKFTPRTKAEAKKGAVVNNIFAELFDGLNPAAKLDGAPSTRINPLTGTYETIDAYTDKVVRNKAAQRRKAQAGRNVEMEEPLKKTVRHRKPKEKRLAELSEKAGDDLHFFRDMETNLDKQAWYSQLEKDIQEKSGSPLPLPSFEFLQCIQYESTKFFDAAGVIPNPENETKETPPPRKRRRTTPREKRRAQNSSSEESSTSEPEEEEPDSAPEEVLPKPSGKKKKKVPVRFDDVPMVLDGLALVFIAIVVQEHAYMTLRDSGLDPEFVKYELERDPERPDILFQDYDSDESGSGHDEDASESEQEQEADEDDDMSEVEEDTETQDA